MNVGFRAGSPGTEQAVTSDEKVTAAQFMSAVEGVQRVPLVLEKIERATGAGSSLIIPGNAGGIAVPR